MEKELFGLLIIELIFIVSFISVVTFFNFVNLVSAEEVSVSLEIIEDEASENLSVYEQEIKNRESIEISGNSITGFVLSEIKGKDKLFFYVLFSLLILGLIVWMIKRYRCKTTFF